MKKNHVIMISISVLVVIGIVIGIILVNFHKNSNVPTNPSVVTTEPAKETTIPAPATTKPAETAKPAETTKPTETTKVTAEEAKELVIFGDKIDLYDKLQLTTTTSGNKELVANLPEGTKIYAPFDGNMIVGTAEIAGYAVRPMTIYRVESEKDGEEVSLSFFVQTWSDVAGNKSVKKGDYLGTIGKSAPILDSISSIKGNNLCFDAIAKGFINTQYSSAKNYIKDFIKLAETFEVKKLDLSSVLQKQTQGK